MVYETQNCNGRAIFMQCPHWNARYRVHTNSLHEYNRICLSRGCIETGLALLRADRNGHREAVIINHASQCVVERFDHLDRCVGLAVALTMQSLPLATPNNIAAAEENKKRGVF